MPDDCREPVDRHAFQARDDKTLTLSLRGATNGNDAAIHRVPGDAFGECGSVTGRSDQDPLKFDIKSGFGRIRIVEKAKKWILIVLGGILLYLYKTCTG